LSVIAIGAALFGVLRLRTRSIQRQKKKLQELVTQQTEELRRLNEEERKAREWADEANKELERKNKELEQFAYVASHDMQEPLRTISSFVGLLQQQYKGKLDERSDKYITFILQASDRMKVLISDLLEYSRIGRKKELSPVDCNLLLRDVLQDLQVAIEEAGAEVSAETLPLVQGYPTELKQLFQNLITNAIKFRKKDLAPRIRIQAQKQHKGWCFSVRDNGIGIDPKHSDRIFVIFQRLHTRTEYEGSGIGLSNCRKIAELHKGKIWVESTPGEGSSFFFTIANNATEYTS
jgi:light-regulated signal transduction histidine kinase (bacteriophytochrome)